MQSAQVMKLDRQVLGTETEQLLKMGQTRLLGNYRQPSMVIERGYGSTVFDTSGKRYIDMMAGVAVCSVGHAHPKLVKAIADQAAKLMHLSNYFYNVENLRLAEELCQLSGFDRVCFCNSGTEANEAMLKLARRHFYAQGDKERTKIVAFHHAFHGRTMGALAMTGTPKYQEGFGPGVGNITHVEYGNIEAVRAVMDRTVAAIIVEPIQGEGGVVMPPVGFLSALRHVADEFGSLLLLDEVQTGIARTGRWFAFEYEDVRADAMTLAKGMGGGFPIGAMLLRESLNAALPPGTHGSTYGGNALASAASRSVLQIVRNENLVRESERKGKYLSEKLQSLVVKYPKLCLEERGLGLLRGLRMVKGTDMRSAMARIREEGTLVTIAGEDVFRFTPPLVVTEAEIDEAIDAVARAFSRMA